MLEGSTSTGSISAAAPSSDPFSRCAIPAPTRICAQFAGIFGVPADHAASATDAASSIAAASPICAATDCVKTACRVIGNDQADSPESGDTDSAARSALARASRARPASPRSAAAFASWLASCTRIGVFGLPANPLRAMFMDSVSRFCQRNVFDSAVMATASSAPASRAKASPAMPYRSARSFAFRSPSSRHACDSSRDSILYRSRCCESRSLPSSSDRTRRWRGMTWPSSLRAGACVCDSARKTAACSIC